MSLIDRRGHRVGTSSQDALDASERALWRMLSFYGTPIDDLDAASAADPAWLLPPLMKAGFLLSLTEPSLAQDAAKILDALDPGSVQATPRERAHHAALQCLANGDWAGACDAWEGVLLEHPRDALALQWAHLFDFYRGDALNLRQRVARVLPEWDAADPLFPYVVGLHAFGLEETNRYAEAEEAGRRALAGAAKVPWAIHAVAHVMEMQGRHVEGIAWMRQWHADWSEGNGFAVHLGWHQALFALEALDASAALALFDRYMSAERTEVTLERLDSAALLWRLHLLGANVGTRWPSLVAGWDFAETSAGFYAFNDLHGLLALIGAGELTRARQWMDLVAARAEAGGAANRAMARDVGTPLMQGMLAFAEGRHDDAIATLYPVRARAHRFGGSHAQRDLIDQTVLAAASRGSSKAAGRALLNERVMAKPRTPLTEHWARQLST